MKKLVAVLLALSLLFVAAGCGEKEEWVEYSPTYMAMELAAGSVNLACSELGAASMEHILQSYGALQPDIAVQISTMNSDDAINAFIRKEADIIISSQGSSREQDEMIVAAHGENQVLYIRLATDAYAVIVNAQNTAVTDLTKEELVGLFTRGTYGPGATWSQLRENWPAEQINRYGLPNGESLMGYFREMLLANKDLEDYTEKESSAAVLAAVAADPNGVAVLSLSTCLQGAEGVKILPLDAGRGPVEPTLENIAGSGTILGLYSEYSFPLYALVSRAVMEEKPQVFDYMWYILSEQGIRVTAQEYQFLALGDEDYANQIDIIANRTKAN